MITFRGLSPQKALSKGNTIPQRRKSAHGETVCVPPALSTPHLPVFLFPLGSAWLETLSWNPSIENGTVALQELEQDAWPAVVPRTGGRNSTTQRSPPYTGP